MIILTIFYYFSRVVAVIVMIPLYLERQKKNGFVFIGQVLKHTSEN